MGRTLIDVAAGQLTMRENDKVEVFNVYCTLKLPSIYEELSAITVVDQIVESQVVVPEDPLERVLIGYEVEGDTEAQEIETCLNLALVDTRKPQVESLDDELGAPPKPSIEDAPKLELKTLLAHLRYAYLATNETFHVIHSAELSELQVDAALRILKRRKKAI
uniref:Integrase core domain containing protein n=1 Tax=Solanum tuberosum TaxID=4113 RepID=M1DBV9_SOLTU